MHFFLRPFSLLFFLLVTSNYAFANSEFVVLPGLEPRVNFWKKVYSEYTTSHAIIHDINNLDVIYEVVYLGNDAHSHYKDKRVEKTKAKYRAILMDLARFGDKSVPLSEEEKRVQMLLGPHANYLDAARNIRVQIGQKDRFQEGLVRSGLYMDKIKRVFREYGLPEELTALPHVESSFQLNAYSSAGAAGIWQFTRQTGRLFMKIGYEVDERMDPMLATVAAAKLLKLNYEQVQSWPLAVTAYNHGLNGMKAAKSQFGDNIVRIIENYRSRSFGFASQNFYSEFLAAVEVSRNHKKYFPYVDISGPQNVAQITLDDSLDLHAAMQHFRLTKEEFMRYNPSLRPPVMAGRRRLPKYFVLKVPADRYDNVEALVKTIPYVPGAGKSRRETSPEQWYSVRRGDTLVRVANRLNLDVEDLKQANQMHGHERLRPGQVIQLPPRAEKSPSFRVAQASLSEPPAPAQPAVASDDSANSYTVKRKDSLTSIAERYNINPMALASFNQITNPDELQPGQVLNIPPRHSSPAEVSGVRVVKKTDHLAVEGKGRSAARGGEESEKVRLAFADGAIDSIENLKKRPAFLPVVFKPAKQTNNMVGSITVDFDETFSHYAEWAGLPMPELRRLNNMEDGKDLKINSKVKIPFNRVTPEKFEKLRQDYHRAIHDSFFGKYRVEKTVTRKIKKGETIWEICNNIYSIPFWLLGVYNPGKNINALSIGETIIVPLITPATVKES